MHHRHRRHPPVSSPSAPTPGDADAASESTSMGIENMGSMEHRKRHNPFAYISLVLALYIVLMQYCYYPTLFGENYDYDDKYGARLITEPKREARLGDGCYHIFLDVGANVGVHGRFLLEPQKYPDTRSSVDLFGKEYGPLDNRDVCIFEFEANPKHWPRLNEVSEAYAKMGWRYHVVEAAVSDQNGNATFFHQGKTDEVFNEWGFSGAKDLSKNYNGKVAEGGYTEEVPTIRLSEWIQTHVHERLVPEVPPSLDGSRSDNNHSSPKPPILGMKMDIEGFEYVVLPDLIHSGAICHFDFVFGEFHSGFAPIRQFNGKDSETQDAKVHRISLETIQEADGYAWVLTQAMHASRHCGVRWIWGDDESYLHDGQPLPTPPGNEDKRSTPSDRKTKQ